MEIPVEQMHNNTLAAAYVTSLLWLRRLNGSSEDFRGAEASVTEYDKVVVLTPDDRRLYRDVLKTVHLVNRSVQHHILEHRASETQSQSDLVEREKARLRGLVEDLGAELQQRLDNSTHLREQAEYYAEPSRERSGRHSLYELAAGLVYAGNREQSIGDLPTRGRTRTPADASSIDSRVAEIGNHTLAAAYLSAGWPATFAADPNGPATQKLATTLQEFSSCLSSATHPVDTHVLQQVRIQANEVFAGWHQAQRLALGLAPAQEMKEEAKQAFLSDTQERMAGLSRLEARLEEELRARLEYSNAVMNEARFFAGAPEADNDAYRPQQLALGLVKAGVAYEHPGSRTPTRHGSMGR